MTDLVNYLLNFAFDHDISVEMVPLPKDFVPRTVPDRRLIILNSTLSDRPIYPFMIGHEIGHIMNGDTGVLYFQCATARYSTEHEADLYSLKMIFDYSQHRGEAFSTPLKFIQEYGIPLKMENAAAVLFAQGNDLM
jgi:Zn-dependent peptidase ImmA (M78 family)